MSSVDPLQLLDLLSSTVFSTNDQLTQESTGLLSQNFAQSPGPTQPFLLLDPSSQWLPYEVMETCDDVPLDLSMKTKIPTIVRTSPSPIPPLTIALEEDMDEERGRHMISGWNASGSSPSITSTKDIDPNALLNLLFQKKSFKADDEKAENSIRTHYRPTQRKVGLTLVNKSKYPISWSLDVQGSIKKVSMGCRYYVNLRPDQHTREYGMKMEYKPLAGKTWYPCTIPPFSQNEGKELYFYNANDDLNEILQNSWMPKKNDVPMTKRKHMIPAKIIRIMNNSLNSIRYMITCDRNILKFDLPEGDLEPGCSIDVRFGIIQMVTNKSRKNAQADTQTTVCFYPYVDEMREKKATHNFKNIQEHYFGLLAIYS